MGDKRKKITDEVVAFTQTLLDMPLLTRGERAAILKRRYNLSLKSAQRAEKQAADKNLELIGKTREEFRQGSLKFYLKMQQNAKRESDQIRARERIDKLMHAEYPDADPEAARLAAAAVAGATIVMRMRPIPLPPHVRGSSANIKDDSPPSAAQLPSDFDPAPAAPQPPGPSAEEGQRGGTAGSG